MEAGRVAHVHEWIGRARCLPFYGMTTVIDCWAADVRESVDVAILLKQQLYARLLVASTDVKECK